MNRKLNFQKSSQKIIEGLCTSTCYASFSTKVVFANTKFSEITITPEYDLNNLFCNKIRHILKTDYFDVDQESQSGKFLINFVNQFSSKPLIEKVF